MAFCYEETQEDAVRMVCQMVLYRVSQKKGNGGFSVPCELKVLYMFTSLNQTSSAEENDTKIIKFGLGSFDSKPIS